MRKLLLGLVAAACAASSATAADMPVKAPLYKAPPPAPVYNWTGLYVGGNVGGAWSHADVASTLIPGRAIPGLGGIFGLPSNIALANALGTGSLSDGGVFTGGGQIGFNWQIGQRWLVGAEGDINSLSHSSTLTGTGASTLGLLTITNSESTGWLATVRGRVGATFDRLLIYGTAGVAFTNASYTQTFSLASAPPAFGSSTVQITKSGWTAGGGVEWALWDKWTAKAEYLYAQFGGLNTTTLVCAPNCAAPVFAQNFAGATSNLNVQIARIGLNYRFW